MRFKNLALYVVAVGNCGNRNLTCWLIAINILLKVIYRPICVVVVAVYMSKVTDHLQRG